MKRRAVLVLAWAWVALVGMPQRTSAQVSPCTGSCVEVSVVPSTLSVAPNGVATVGLTFTQAPPTGQAGGPDKIAAVALTLNISDSATDVPLQLNDCTLNAAGLPASVTPDASISNFNVVVENVSCANRTHCLCPDPGSGITPDNFINLVVYGPNPIPTPGPNPIDIPTLPAGPQQLLTIDLKVAGTATGTIPLHLYNQVQDTQHPQFTAFLSVGDKVAVDQTCVPATGQPPCSGSATSQVTTADGAIAVAVVVPTPTLTPVACPPGDVTCTSPCQCVDDCNLDGSVFGNEVTKAVNIVAGTADLSTCPQADANCDGNVFGNEVTIGVNNVANGCPGASQ